MIYQGDSSSLGTQTVEALVMLLVVATVVGIVAQRIRVPYTVSLVLVGFVLKVLGIEFNIPLTQELLLTVFLPVLLFEAAIHFPANELRKFAPTIATLAAPGVVVTAIATALVLQLGFAAFGFNYPIGFIHFLLFGTIIAATDPVSVITLMRQLNVERRLAVLIEGESLFNDGTAIVLYTVVLGMLQSGVFEPTQAFGQFLYVSFGGIFIGALLGLFAINLLLRLITDHLLAIAFTTAIAYGSYLIAEQFHVSGILATVASGLFIGNVGKKRALNPTTRIAVASFWEYAAFFIGSLVFLLIGIKTDPVLLKEKFWLIVLAFIAVVASRWVCVFLPLPFLRRAGQPLTFKMATVVWWSGLRGSLSLVLVLSLPDSMGIAKDVLIAMTFGVVLLSVVIQGSTFGFVLKFLGFVKKETEASAYLSQKLARLRAIFWQQQEVSRFIDKDWPQTHLLKTELEQERKSILNDLKSREEQSDMKEAMSQKLSEVRQELRNVARASYRHSLNQNLINEDQMEHLLNKLEYEKHASHQTSE